MDKALFIPIFFASITLLLFSPVEVAGAGLRQARISATTGEVNLASTAETHDSVSTGDEIEVGMGLTTADNSRAELIFNNGVVARLSADSVLSFKARNFLELTRGAVLFDVPRRAKGKIEAAGVTVALSDEIAIFEYQPPAFKFLVVYGTGRVYRPRHLGDSALILPGQMIFGDVKDRLGDPLDFNIDRFVRTCPLIQALGPLRRQQAIASASQQQQSEKSKKLLFDTNLVIAAGGGSTVSIINPATIKGTASPAPTPTTNPK